MRTLARLLPLPLALPATKLNTLVNRLIYSISHEKSLKMSALEMRDLKSADSIQLKLAPTYDDEANTVTMNRDRYERVVARLQEKKARMEYGVIAVIVFMLCGGAYFLGITYWANDISKESHVVLGQMRWV